MDLTVKKIVDVPVRYLDLEVAVRYDEEDIPNDAPLRVGDLWKAVIDLEDGTVVNWPQGKTLSMDSMKVCDEGVYILRDADMQEVLRREDYVPNNLLPGEYGDYLSLKIDEAGKITNWLVYADLSDFKQDCD